MTSYDDSATLLRTDTLSPGVATWYSELSEARQNLLDYLKRVPDEAIDFTPHETRIETIGTLLLHIAAIEWSWIFEDIDGMEMDMEEWKDAFALRRRNPVQLKGQGKQFYIDRLNRVRTEVYERISKFGDEDLGRLVVGDDKREYSIEWILYHILEHEAMHMGQIMLLNRLHQLERHAAAEA